MATTDRDGLVPALLKHWRRQRGLSQLDLAVAADVSARHISFIETGRSNPSPEIVVLLGTTLGVPLRHINTMLRAAGHRAVFDETNDPMPSSVTRALELLKDHHEPFPIVVMDTTYRVLDLNKGAAALLETILGSDFAANVGPGSESEALGTEATPARPRFGDLNLARLTFDPEGAKPYLANFEELGRQLLWRIQREVLADPEDTDLAELLDELLEMPTVDPQWRHIDLSQPSEPALTVHIRVGELELHFLTTVTAFQAPQNLAVERTRIESWFPCDDVTASLCHALATT